MDTLKAVNALFRDWSREDVGIRQNPDGSVAVGLGWRLVGAPEVDGGVAGKILTLLATNRCLSVSMPDVDRPTVKELLMGVDVLVVAVRGWRWVVTDDLPEQVSIADLTRATGLARNTVREQVRRWVLGGQLGPVDGFGEHGALRYPVARVRELVELMPGSGNWGPRS